MIAQDVQKVLPQLVKEHGSGYLGVRHDRLVGLLVESIKDQQEQINELKLQNKHYALFVCEMRPKDTQPILGFGWFLIDFGRF